MGLIRKWNVDNKALTDKCISEIITRIEELDGDTPGVIAAQDILDIVMENLGPEVYNKALDEVGRALSNRFDDTLTDIELMKAQR